MDISRTHLIEELNSSMEGQDVIFGGWVVDLRKLGKMAFLTVRDVTGMCQVIVKGDSMSLLEGLNRQSVVRISGKVQASKAKDFDFEILAIEIQILAKAEYPLPIDPIGRLESDIDNRLNSRALDMRNQKTASIFKLRSQVLTSIRETLINKKFIEINTPKIIGSASEGGADLFGLDYFGKQAYLAQSPQLYKEQMTIGLERVFEISSFYRAEKSHTGRHLSEFTSVDIEAAMMDYTDVMDVLESIVIDVFKNTSENSKTEQQEIGHEIKVPKSPFERVTYTQALEELSGLDIKIEFGEDLQDSHLRSLGEKHPGFFFLTDWPMKLKPFYIHEKDDDPTLSRSFDLQYGYLELSSGGRRLHDPEQLKTRLKEQDLDPASFEEHLENIWMGNATTLRLGHGIR